MRTRPREAVRFAGAALLLSALLFIPLLSPAAAADGDPVRLSFGDQGSVPWSVGPIKPGDRGAEDVALHNSGSEDGLVLLWIGNIEERDAAGDGASLGRHLRFSIGAEGLAEAPPRTVYELPRYPSGADQMIFPLPAGSSITVHWAWEFVDTGTPQNEAQGDGLSFDINYLLYERPPDGQECRWVLFDVLGKETAVGVSATGHVLEDVKASDPRGMHSIHLPPGTRIATADGQVPSAVAMTVEAAVPPGTAPQGWTPAGPSYLIRGYLEEGEVDVSFIGNATLTLGADPSAVPPGTGATAVFARAADGRWTRAEGSGPTSTSWEATGAIGGTGAYAVLAGAAPSEHAFITATDLAVRPGSSAWWPIPLVRETGRTVSAAAALTNSGDIAGSFEVRLLVDGKVMTSETVVLGPGESREAILSAGGLSYGGHEVGMAGLAGSFRTEAAIIWPAVILMAMVLWTPLLLATRKGRAPPALPPDREEYLRRRVLRELASGPLSFKDLSLRTGAAGGALVQVLDGLWKEGRVGASEGAPPLRFTDRGRPPSEA